MKIILIIGAALLLAACQPSGGGIGDSKRTFEQQARWECDQARSQTERNACLKASGLR